MPSPSPDRDPRRHLVHALEADLVGPFLLDDAAPETLPLAPSRWYLTGFLAPEGSAEVDTSTEEDDAGAGDDDDDADTGAQEAQPKAPRRLPSSIGLTVLLPPGTEGDTVMIRLSYAEYTLDPAEAASAEQTAGKKTSSASARQRWTRRPHEPLTWEPRLDPAVIREGKEITQHIHLEGHLHDATARGLDDGIRALSLFVVNRRKLGEPGRTDEQFIFQVTLEVRHAKGLSDRPNRRDEASDDWDEKVADLQFRHHREWCVGHNVAAEPIEEGGRVVGARTTWIPTATVPRVATLEIKAVETGMEALAALPDGAAARAALSKLDEEYATWIADKRLVPLETDLRRETRDVLMYRANEARRRIAEGIERLATDPEALAAFKLANRAMAMAARQQRPGVYGEGKDPPRWRLFQLAFVLLNIPGIVDDTHEDRESVELIFFPTGGGKTEAYLGVIAFTLLLRRLRGAKRPDQGLGVAILLRYTLRLLTLDQLGRAATLICALELLRREAGDKLGDERFAVGLWVGRSATANTMTQAVDEIRDFKNARGPSPFPLPSCPWCKSPIAAGSLEVLPSTSKPETVRVGCSDPRCQCPFIAAESPEGIPVVFVDEHIYRELPCFLVATVDKFAMLPWRGRTGMLFGRVHGRIGNQFFGPMDGAAPPKQAVRLPGGIRPPELIVQDELHLISGPLGTMVGLYETGIEELCAVTSGERRVLPKILASTATVRRAEQQVRSLFGRAQMKMFPPLGVDDADTFFADVDRKSPGRLYAGVAAPGRAMKAILIHTYVALLGGAEHGYDGTEATDAYMTLVGYFNSLRELGGMRRMLEGEVRDRVSEKDGPRVPVDRSGAPHPWTRPREIDYEPIELTSRVSTANIALAKDRLKLLHAEEKHVDVVLASNMISVGVDIDRLGLMVVAGQPKTTSEYIQASSRVGRDRERPGLVVTVFNLFKPRDRSHYERFRAYHECFYRFVEASSVTPFSAPALERGLAGLLVAMTRLGEPAMTPADGARRIEVAREAAARAVARIAEKAGREKAGIDQADAVRIADQVKRLGDNLVEAWAEVAKDGSAAAVGRYSRLEPGQDRPPLLFTTLDLDAPPVTSPSGKFRAATSMRDVEPSVHLWKSRIELVPAEDERGE